MPRSWVEIHIQHWEYHLNFSYRVTLVDRETGRFRNARTTIDTDTWLQRIADNKQGMYSNTKDVVQTNLLPTARDEDLDLFYSLYFEAYEAWAKFNIVVTFEFAMYMWAQYKAGQISNKVWAAVLAVAWQSGSRGMLACVVLTATQVREMFKAADFQTLLYFGSNDEEDMNALYESLPETLTVHRGVSTGISHFEDGFSWTLDHTTEPMRFAVLNCQTKKEIPGIVTATIRKEAVLSLFWFESEVVVDPLIPKLEVEKAFLRGNDLRKFHKRYNVEGNTQDVVQNWGRR